MLRMLLVTILVPTLAWSAAAQQLKESWTPADEKKSNLVIIYCDDLGWGDLASFGHPTIATPRLDQMANEGARFTQFYSASPACTASRYALLTGRVPKRSGFAWVLGPKSPRGLHANEVTIADGLKQQGYATAIFGKWHLGRPEAHLPLAHGFDEYLGLPYSNDMRPPKWQDIPLIDGNEIVELNPDQRKLTRLYTDRAIDFIDRHQEQNFFVYLPYAMPHLPLYPGEDFTGESARGTYGDVVEEIDHHVGRLLDHLTQLGLAEDTLVVFTSDNGPWIIKNEEGGSSGLLRDGKGSTWEGGVRVPTIFWQPGVIEAGRVVRETASTLDLLPTAFARAGLALPDKRILDGRDMSAILRGESVDRDPLYFYGPSELHAVRMGPWKLHIKTSSQTGKKHFDGKLPLLFHLEHDPSEQYDLADDYPDVVLQMQALIVEHREDIAANPSDWDLEAQSR